MTRDPHPAPESDPPRLLLPAGAPPGLAYLHDERPPEGVYYFRFYAGFMAFIYAGVTLIGFVMMFMPLFAPSSRVPGTEVASWLAGVLYAGMGTAFFIPTAIALFGGRKPWVHTLGTIVVALGMTSFCCVPLLIPILINWLKPETKRWYGAR